MELKEVIGGELSVTELARKTMAEADRMLEAMRDGQDFINRIEDHRLLEVLTYNAIKRWASLSGNNRIQVKFRWYVDGAGEFEVELSKAPQRRRGR